VREAVSGARRAGYRQFRRARGVFRRETAHGARRGRAV